MRIWVLCVVAILFAGCATPGRAVKEIDIHIGWTSDGKSQYMEPKEIRVKQGDRVRLVITNDDDPNRDYNGNSPGSDNFHDLALANYDTDGDGDKETLEHEVPAGRTVSTCLVAQNPCPEGKDFFIAATKGTFKLFCEVGNNGAGKPTRHEALGMWANLIVE